MLKNTFLFIILINLTSSCTLFELQPKEWLASNWKGEVCRRDRSGYGEWSKIAQHDCANINITIPKFEKDIQGFSYVLDQPTIAKIENNEEYIVYCTLNTDESVGNHDVKMIINIKEGNHFDLSTSLALQFKTKEILPPLVKVIGTGIDDENGDARIDPGEMVTLTVRLRNLGVGHSRETRVKVNLFDNVFLEDGMKKFSNDKVN